MLTTDLSVIRGLPILQQQYKIDNLEGRKHFQRTFFFSFKKTLFDGKVLASCKFFIQNKSLVTMIH